jgi:hypothetical protein
VTLGIGTRVTVRRDPEFGPGPWPAEPEGRIAGPPESVQGRDGFLTTYWVVFDEPQLDTDGDGPYESSQVLERHLEVVE